MSKQDLVPITSTAQAKELGRKGGLVSSPAKSLAAKLRELKKKGITDASAQKLYDLMTDSESIDLDILILIQTMKNTAKTLAEREKISRLLLDWRKVRHGSNIEIRSYNENINATISEDDMRKYMAIKHQEFIAKKRELENEKRRSTGV